MTPRDTVIGDNAVSRPSSSAEVTSKTPVEISEPVIEPQTEEEDHPLPEASEETGVNLHDVEGRATPPTNRANVISFRSFLCLDRIRLLTIMFSFSVAHSQASEFNSVQQHTDESGGVSFGQQELVEEDIATSQDWDPLRSSTQESSAEKETRRLDLVPASDTEDGVAVLSIGKDVPIEVEKNDDVLRVQSPTTATSRRTSHLRLDLASALPSAQSWDTDEPLSSLTRGKVEYPESETASQPKFPPYVLSSFVEGPVSREYGI